MYLGDWHRSTLTDLGKSITYATSTRQNRVCVPRNCQSRVKGFKGIRDGLGRDELSLDFERLADGAELVALAGANGRGKTTVMDNMHPFLIMPSRAAVAGPGGFSYYDHVYLPENEKDKDRDTVRAMPEFMELAGFRVFRLV